MNKLFRRKAQVEAQLKRVWKASVLKSSDLRIPYAKLSPLFKELKEAERVIDLNRRLLAKIIERLSDEIKRQAQADRLKQVSELAEIAYTLAGLLYQEKTLRWARPKEALRRYQTKYGRLWLDASSDVVSILDDIISANHG